MEAQSESAPALCLCSSLGPVFSVELFLVVVWFIIWGFLLVCLGWFGFCFLGFLLLFPGIQTTKSDCWIVNLLDVRWPVSESCCTHRRNHPRTRTRATLRGSIRSVFWEMASRTRRGLLANAQSMFSHSVPYMFPL